MSEEVKTCPHCGKDIITKKNRRFTPDLSYIENEELRKIFNLWCFGKSKKYKNQIQVEAAFKKLVKLSNSNTEEATEIIQNSLSANWEGLFPLKKPEFATGGMLKEKDNRSSYDRMQEKYGR